VRNKTCARLHRIGILGSSTRHSESLSNQRQQSCDGGRNESPLHVPNCPGQQSSCTVEKNHLRYLGITQSVVIQHTVIATATKLHVPPAKWKRFQNGAIALTSSTS
jgi:hypothetical protein